MRNPVRNAIVVGGCAVLVTVGYAQEQFSPHAIDTTPLEAHYAGGTVTVQAERGYVVAPPNGPVDGGIVLRELRWDRA
jgi:hypothetical protein